MSNWRLFTSAPRYWQSWIEASPSPPVAECIKTRCKNERHFFERDPYTYMAFLRVGKIKKTIYGCQVNTGQCRCLLQVYQHRDRYCTSRDLTSKVMSSGIAWVRSVVAMILLPKVPFSNTRTRCPTVNCEADFPTLLMTPAPSSPRRC